MGGRFPRRRNPEPATGRGRGDGCPAPPALHQDAMDEPRPQRARVEPRRPEVLRHARDLEKEMKAVGGTHRVPWFGRLTSAGERRPGGAVAGCPAACPPGTLLAGVFPRLHRTTRVTREWAPITMALSRWS